jgi:hypothetical protein
MSLDGDKVLGKKSTVPSSSSTLPSPPSPSLEEELEILLEEACADAYCTCITQHDPFEPSSTLDTTKATSIHDFARKNNITYTPSAFPDFMFPVAATPSKSGNQKKQQKKRLEDWGGLLLKPVVKRQRRVKKSCG